MRTPPQWGEPAGPNGGAASHADARCRRDWRRHSEDSMTIERGTSNPKRASFRWLKLAWTMLALACGGNDLGPTTPPGATNEGKSGSATSAGAPAPVFTSVSITPATASVV